MAEGQTENKEDVMAEGQTKTQKNEFKFEEKKGDLFACPNTDSMAHCISEDIRMGKGIAVIFKKKFGGVEELHKQGVKPGGVAVLKRGERFIYYLVTKKKYSDKPTYDSLRASLVAMKKHCLDNKVTCISMPRIGCGLDQLQWEEVSLVIMETFHDTNIQFSIYYL